MCSALRTTTHSFFLVFSKVRSMIIKLIEQKHGKNISKDTFEVDANAILNVKAKDTGTGKSEKITITNEKERLSQEEIKEKVEAALKDALEWIDGRYPQNAEDDYDAKLKEAEAVCNPVISAVYQRCGGDDDDSHAELT
ncbi:hypothetical protein BHE74_00045419 [Ensete ventricosum]|nr:hypothetical protein BHE74_00045419 [Ensete ventricosum]